MFEIFDSGIFWVGKFFVVIFIAGGRGEGVFKAFSVSLGAKRTDDDDLGIFKTI